MAALRSIWQFMMGVKDFLALLFLLLFFGLLWAALSGRAPLSVPQGAALHIDLDGVLVEQYSDQSPLALLSGSDFTQETRVRDVLAALKAAREDGRVKAVAIDLDGFVGGGQANMAAIGAEIERVKRAGKPVHVYATAYLDDGYRLAAHASKVWVNPLGGVFLTGPGGTGPYFAQALDRLGITMNVFRVGTFKAAIEPFIRNDQSPEAEAAEQAVVDALWRDQVAGIRTARPKADPAGYVADLPVRLEAANKNLSQAALNAGLVDAVGDWSALASEMRGVVGEGKDGTPGDFNRVGLGTYAAAVAHKLPTSGDAVGVVYVAGTIVDGESGGGEAAGDTIAGLIEDALGDRSIKALVVRIDSPGGSVTASERIRAALSEAKARKIPVVASMGPLAASGGYWVATPAQTIFAQPSTITGSIGVFALIPSFEEARDKLGIGADGVRSTPLSGEPDLLRGLGAPAQALFQASVEDIYARFLTIVGEARGKTPAQIDPIAQGRIWDGAAAQRLGLVDRMGTLDDALAEARKLAGLSADSRVVAIEPTPWLPPELVRSLLGASPPVAAAPVDAIGKSVNRAALRLGSAIATATALATRPSVQALCTECLGFTAPGGRVSADALALARAAATARADAR
jgi:protease-4